MKIVLGQIVALTKSILLQSNQPGGRDWVQFIAGKRPRFSFRGGIGLSWSANEDLHTNLEAVASLVIAGQTDFKDCDLATAERVTIATLQEICLDDKLFKADEVFMMKRLTLFDCHRLAVPEFAATVLSAIEANLRSEIGKVCTVYVLPRFLTESFALQDKSLHVIAKQDTAAWQALVDRGYVFGGWSPSRPKQDGCDDLVYTPSCRIDTVLAAEELGTQSGVHFNSAMRFRQLIALLYASVSNRSQYPIHKSIAQPPEFCIQFIHRDRAEWHLSRRDCRPLVPVYCEDVVVNAADRDRVAAWYQAVSKLSEDSKGRAEKGAHFFNRGMVSDDIESFVNYFISLDAVFGERNSVEASILDGLGKLGCDSTDIDRARWLFDLRSELVHGGSRYIAEWPKYVRYRNHFRSEPANDVQRIARVAVLRAPEVLEK